MHEFHEAAAILEHLAHENPGVTKYKHDMAKRHINIGFVNYRLCAIKRINNPKQTRELDEHKKAALDAYGKALGILEPLIDKNQNASNVTEYLRFIEVL